jgi:hypothetical protein
LGVVALVRCRTFGGFQLGQPARSLEIRTLAQPLKLVSGICHGVSPMQARHGCGAGIHCGMLVAGGQNSAVFGLSWSQRGQRRLAASGMLADLVGGCMAARALCER